MNEALTMLYRQFDAECAHASDKVNSSRDFEPVLFVPTERAIREHETLLHGLLQRAAELPAPDPVYLLLQTHFCEFLKGQISSLKTRQERPGQSIGAVTRYIDFIARKDSRSTSERRDRLKERLAQVDALWAGITESLDSTPPNHLQELVQACEMLGRVITPLAHDLGQGMPELAAIELQTLQSALQELIDKSIRWAGEAGRVLGSSKGMLGSQPSSNDDIIKLDGDYYRRLLREELGVELDELLTWHEAEVEKTRAEVFEIASKLDLGGRATPATMGEVFEILNTFAGPCDTVAEMFARGNDYLQRAKAGTAGYVKLPPETCLIGSVPEQIRGHYPWGGYGGGCSRRRPLVGEMFLNDTNYQAVTDGWLKMMAIHEAYPGHHLQWVRATLDPLPETVKLGARSVPLIEGTAHRSERVFEFVFPEDPFYPLFVAYRRHHTSVRIKAELWLRYFGRPIGDAVNLYMDELGFDQATARGQVKAQELMVGYFNCYYYGMKRLTDLEAEHGYDERTFTELLFSVGRVSLPTFEAFLNLSETDKSRFLTCFPSLLANS